MFIVISSLKLPLIPLGDDPPLTNLCLRQKASLKGFRLAGVTYFRCPGRGCSIEVARSDTKAKRIFIHLVMP